MKINKESKIFVITSSKRSVVLFFLEWHAIISISVHGLEAKLSNSFQYWKLFTDMPVLHGKPSWLLYYSDAFLDGRLRDSAACQVLVWFARKWLKLSSNSLKLNSHSFDKSIHSWHLKGWWDICHQWNLIVFILFLLCSRRWIYAASQID